ncbi:hypothetical protein Chor_007218, partial [Crotalus horridus]
PPEKIELYPVPETEVGKLYNLTCQVFGVAPIRNLTVTLLKGEEQLLVKTFENYAHPEAGTVVVNHSIIAQKDDYSKTVTCQTSLDLRPRGPLLKNTSYSISLWTFGEIPSIAPGPLSRIAVDKIRQRSMQDHGEKNEMELELERISNPGASNLLCYEDNCTSQMSNQKF